jgi:NADP-dependent 3-hydroxy acid dehydrogenase YdfG
MTLDSHDVALVTGASSGIGEATVRALRSRNVEVHAAARRIDRLDALAAETGCIPHQLDVRDRAAVAALGAAEPFTIVVNNAGLGRAMGSLWTADPDDIERTIDTNVTSAIHVLRAVLPGMVERGNGHVVNMSSVLALYPGPAALYGASKGALHKLSRDLRLELAGTGIRVTEINPGRVSTEFYDVAVDDPETRRQAKDTGIEEIQPSDVADAIVFALDAPWRVNISMIEIAPTEQTYGGAQFVPVDRS